MPGRRRFWVVGPLVLPESYHTRPPSGIGLWWSAAAVRHGGRPGELAVGEPKQDGGCQARNCNLTWGLVLATRMKDLSESRILIVDDTRANVDVLVGALQDRYKLSVALDGAGALRI